MRGCFGLCDIIHPHLNSARYSSGGKPYRYCYTCEKSFPAEKGYYTRDSIGRAECPCCKQLLRCNRRSPESRKHSFT